MDRYSSQSDTSVAGDGRAFVVGPNDFQNALLAVVIEAHCTWKCSAVNEISAIPPCDEENPFCRKAILYDCFSVGSEGFTECQLQELRSVPMEWLLVLFNLEHRVGIENYTLEIGANGFFYRDDSIDMLLKGLDAVFDGELWVSRRKIAELILSNTDRFRNRLQLSHQDTCHCLTRREVEVLGLLSSGATNEAIAEKMFISPHTVRTHLNHIFRKIKVSNRIEALNWASDNLFEHQNK